MSLVKDKHNVIFKKLIDELRDDLGRSITVVKQGTATACTYCYLDKLSNQSSGVQKLAWSGHPDYIAGTLVCPNCKGAYYTYTRDNVTVNDVIISDLSGQQKREDKVGFYKAGTKKILGKLSDILITSTDADSDTILTNAIKILIDNEEYRVVTVSKTGLKDRYLFSCIVEKYDSLS